MSITLHKILVRQLNHFNLDKTLLPQDEQKWQDFIERVSSTYTEFDNERYLIERSMEISSKELLTLNNKLENAQHIAGLGYWYYNQENESISWSKELYTLLGFIEGVVPPNFEQFVFMIHENDRDKFKEMITNTLNSKISHEGEIRVTDKNQGFGWFYFVSNYDENGISGIAINITKRKQTEEEIQLLNQQLISTARRAGMSDIATAILHNVGNILNSANVSVSMMKENMDQSSFNKFFKLTTILKSNLEHLNEYLTQDEKGKLIPKYLISLSESLESEFYLYIKEIDNLTVHLRHIKDIIATQQTVNSVSRMDEKVYLPEMIDIALQMIHSHLEKYNITLSLNYEEKPYIIVDKTKLLQILVNLIQNAGDALIAIMPQHAKTIEISIEVEKETDQVKIKVKDNGVGIPKENLNRIFSFGFTTKKNGHGFGLHSSGLVAQEMGGKLYAESEGESYGSIFILTLPLYSTKVKIRNGELQEYLNT